MTIHLTFSNFLGAFILLTLSSIGEAVASTYCVSQDGSQQIEGPAICDALNEVWMLGTYVNLGINNAGTFGTFSSINTPYYSGQLGMLSNYAKDDFQTYAGDYLTWSLGIEGTRINFFHYSFVLF